jgi:hypothetical protein
VSLNQDPPEGLIWATRGRSWGFRFLIDGGRPDPLLDYERIFANVGNDPGAFRHLAGNAALRFPDPRGRRDSAGRVILHEFVITGALADEIGSIEDGLRRVWPLVAGAYAQVWDARDPPSAGDLDFTASDA